jgi:hypothetical protein
MSNVTYKGSSFELEEIISQTVTQTLVKLGIDVSDPIAVQKDFAHLRSWREGSEAIKRTGFLTLLGLVITGAAGLLWAALKTSLH